MVSGSAPRRRGYSLLELLVVVVIAALLIGIAIPAFSAIVSSSRRSLAESKLQQAMYAARDAAAASVGGGDAAAVFLWDPDVGVQAIICRQVGTISDETDGERVTRDVFVPASGFEPLQLPPNYGVRGFAVTTVFENGWYESLEDATGDPGYWVFPETHAYPVTGGSMEPGIARQTFMVRFNAGTGTLSRDSRQAVVIAPVADEDFANWAGPQLGMAGIDDTVLTTDDVELWTRRVVSSRAAALIGDQSQPLQDRDLRGIVLGDRSPHSVLASSVGEVALYLDREFSGGIGAQGVNRRTGNVYLPAGPTVTEALVDGALFGGDAGEARDPLEATRLGSRWIEGRLTEADLGGREPLEPTARIFAINPYFADLVEITR
ncbi:MAG: prepilin-type N-terminal cleavage/methylation domain-containing protein [Planctomycetota bacterium]